MILFLIIIVVYFYGVCFPQLSTGREEHGNTSSRELQQEAMAKWTDFVLDLDLSV